MLKDEGITSVPQWVPPEGTEEDSASVAEASVTEQEDSAEEEEDNVTVRDTESPLRDVSVEELSLREGSKERDLSALKKDKETRNSLKKERKDSTGPSRKERKKKDSLSSDSSSRDGKKDEGDEKTKGAVRKMSLAKTRSNSIEEGKISLFHIYISLLLFV